MLEEIQEKRAFGKLFNFISFKKSKIKQEHGSDFEHDIYIIGRIVNCTLWISIPIGPWIYAKNITQKYYMWHVEWWTVHRCMSNKNVNNLISPYPGMSKLQLDRIMEAIKW